MKLADRTNTPDFYTCISLLINRHVLERFLSNSFYGRKIIKTLLTNLLGREGAILSLVCRKGNYKLKAK